MASSLFYAFFFSSFAIFYFSRIATAELPSSINDAAVKTRQSFLNYHTQPPYNTVSPIASLFSANASQITTMNNNIGENITLATNTRVAIPVTLSSCGTKKKWEYFWKGVAVGAAVVSVLGFILLCILIRKFDRIVSSRSFEKSLEIQKAGVYGCISKKASLKVHSFKDLQAATENFSSDHAIKVNLHSDLMSMEKK